MGCDISVRIGGEAGQGMNVISNLLGRVFVRSGLRVFIYQDVMSRIRGGQNFSQIRISDRAVHNLSGKVDILVCLDKGTLQLYSDITQGIILYDPSQYRENPPEGKKYLPVPLDEMAGKIANNPKMANTVATGAVLAVLGMPMDILSGLLREIFSRKDEAVIHANIECAEAGHEYVRQTPLNAMFCLPSVERQKKRMLVTGSEAVALGALEAGIKFYTAYPMSPSTAVMEYLASKQNDYGIIVEQAEDELAAINSALGASFAGARAMTGTSGGGLALMTEGISLSGMTETPVVILDGQRPGPATGLPTRTEQGDLLYVLHSGHGEFPRAIFAPSNAQEAFYLTGKAFYLAEKYQIPVFVLGDQYLLDSSWTVDGFHQEETFKQQYGCLTDDELTAMSPYQYRRYEITASGVSPRIRPGTSGQVQCVDSDEHSEEGHITESAEIRRKMTDKRLRKTTGLLSEMRPPRIYPDEGATRYIISWGTNAGVVEETVKRLRGEGKNIGFIHFSEVYPLRKGIIPENIAKNAILISVENNATGQFAKLLRMECGIEITRKVLKYDGRPFTADELIEKVKELA